MPPVQKAHRNLERDGYLVLNWGDGVYDGPRKLNRTDAPISRTVEYQWGGRSAPRFIYHHERGLVRPFTWREVARLQGFPERWFNVMRDAAGEIDPLKGNHIVSMLGNAVPIPLGRLAVGSLIATAEELKVPIQTKAGFEICCGIGGLSAALPDRGWTVAAGLDLEPKRLEPVLEVFKDNFPGSQVIKGNCLTYNYVPWRGKIGILLGGPPCQPYSSAGSHLGQDDPRDVLGRSHEILQNLSPDLFVFEEAPTLVELPMFAEYLRDVAGRFAQQGYAVAVWLMDARSAGLPQSRQRTIILGCRIPPNHTRNSFLTLFADTLERRIQVVSAELRSNLPANLSVLLDDDDQLPALKPVYSQNQRRPLVKTQSRWYLPAERWVDRLKAGFGMVSQDDRPEKTVRKFELFQ
jgi:site-specific DNA-cytosine methylase